MDANLTDCCNHVRASILRTLDQLRPPLAKRFGLSELDVMRAYELALLRLACEANEVITPGVDIAAMERRVNDAVAAV